MSGPIIIVWEKICWAIGCKCCHTDLAWERKWLTNTGTQGVLTYNLNLYDLYWTACHVIIEVNQGLAPQIVGWVTSWNFLIPKPFWAALSSGNRLQHLNRFCRAHCTHPSGATAGVDCQWFSLYKASRLVRQCEDRTVFRCLSPFNIETHILMGKSVSADFSC